MAVLLIFLLHLSTILTTDSLLIISTLNNSIIISIPYLCTSQLFTLVYPHDHVLFNSSAVRQNHNTQFPFPTQNQLNQKARISYSSLNIAIYFPLTKTTRKHKGKISYHSYQTKKPSKLVLRKTLKQVCNFP